MMEGGVYKSAARQNGKELSFLTICTRKIQRKKKIMILDGVSRLRCMLPSLCCVIAGGFVAALRKPYSETAPQGLQDSPQMGEQYQQHQQNAGLLKSDGACGTCLPLNRWMSLHTC